MTSLHLRPDEPLPPPTPKQRPIYATTGIAIGLAIAAIAGVAIWFADKLGMIHLKP